MYCYFLLLVFSMQSVAALKGDKININITIPELRGKLRKIFGGRGALTDFVFFTKDDLDGYQKENPTPLNRTELKPLNPVKARNGSITEKILAKALKRYRKASQEEKQAISKATKALVRYFDRENGNSPRRQEDSFGWEFYESAIDEVFEEMEDEVQTRERRSVDSEKTCLAAGTSTTASDRLRLCTVCYSVIDFGEHMLPRYANNIECAGASSDTCLSEDGQCIQKVLYFNFQKYEDNSWVNYEQPLNVSCECECKANTVSAELHL